MELLYAKIKMLEIQIVERDNDVRKMEQEKSEQISNINELFEKQSAMSSDIEAKL